MAPFSTLIVEDFEDYRCLLHAMLQRNTQCEVVGEAADGFEAVRKAEELQPELILLDIALPTLNGIEAARRIRKCSPNSKILFLSQNSDPEIAQAALRLGAHGYLVKSDAVKLPLAIEEVLKGKQFLSSRFETAFTEGAQFVPRTFQRRTGFNNSNDVRWHRRPDPVAGGASRK
jgi:DNA-binding NarL/FixJ family response regulator